MADEQSRSVDKAEFSSDVFSGQAHEGKEVDDDVHKRDKRLWLVAGRAREATRRAVVLSREGMTAF